MFDKMSKEEYRKLDTESFEARCQVVLAELQNKDSEVALNDLIAEKDMIVEERKLRDSEIQLRNAMVKEVGKGAGNVIERSVKTVKEDKVMPENINDTEAYTRAFYEFATAGKEIPVELRAGNAVTSDRTAVIPSTIMSRIIEKMETYGELYAKVTKTNIKGGVEYPVLELKPNAAWVAENAQSTKAKVTSTSTVSFKYHELECVLSQSRLAAIVTMDEFQAKFPELVAQAMAKAIDIAIVKGTGSGQPVGIVNAAGATKVELKDGDLNSWEAWHKNVKAKMKKSYRNGEFIMAQSTFDAYIDGMTDKNGQPIARTNYGIDGAETYRFMGKNVIIVEDDVLPGFDDASTGDVFAIFCDLKDYAINTNQQLQFNKWTDFDTRTDNMSAYMVLDGKLIDENGVILMKKKAGSSRSQ